MSKLFRALEVGEIGRLSHRVVLAPLTLNRAAEPTLAPSDLAVQYYSQRASAGGLLITEATHISPESLAYPSTPGIWSAEQVQGWRKVTKAVHEKGAFIVCQLWHTGRVAHPSFGSHPTAESYLPQLYPGVSASAVGITNRRGQPGRTLTYSGVQDHATPRELSADEDIPRILSDYRRAARNALSSGFDGIEVHAAHGYLIDQFLNDGVNQRKDRYGGPNPENRCRLLREVIEAILDVMPPGKVGVRLSPHDGPNGGNTYYACRDSNPDVVYSTAVQLVNSYNLAYLLLTEPRWVGKHDANPETDPGFQMPLVNLNKYRGMYSGTLIGAGGFTPRTLENDYDMLAFGRWFIANPDLPERLRRYVESKSNKTDPPLLNRYQRDTFYTNGADGYIDYPSLVDQDENMLEGKYALVHQDDIGQSLAATRSKL